MRVHPAVMAEAGGWRAGDASRLRIIDMTTRGVSVTEMFRLTETAVVKRKPRARRRAEPVDVQQVDRRVLARAKQLAGGDTSRFVFVPARSRRYPAAFGIAVVVTNHSRA